MYNEDTELVEVQTLFDAFLSLVASDEWDAMEDEAVYMDFLSLYRAAVNWFMFPRCSLELDGDEEYFVDPKISNEEIQVLALYMKYAWYSRVVDSWENIRPYYSERDFSPGKMLAEFKGRLAEQLKTAKQMENRYYRSNDRKPFKYRNLASRG